MQINNQWNYSITNIIYQKKTNLIIIVLFYAISVGKVIYQSFIGWFFLRMMPNI